MKNKLILFIFLSLILINKCQDDEFPEENLNDTFDDSFDDNGFFKSSLKEFLLEKDLYDSNRPIKPNELRKIFLEVISEGDPEKTPIYLKKIFNQLTEYFIEKYYKENKQIAGKDIINLFDINEISSQFDKIVGDTTLYDIYGEEEDSQDSRDAVGEPKTEL